MSLLRTALLFIGKKSFPTVNNRENRERKYNTLPTLILAFMMIITGTMMVIVRVFGFEHDDSSYFVEDTYFGLAGRAILILGGLVILYFRKKGNYFAVGLYALTLGLSRIIRSLPGLVDESDFSFYLSLVFIIIGGNLAWGGYNHLTVKTRNPATMRYMSLALLAIFGFALGYTAYSGGDVVDAFLSDINIMAYLPLYAGLLIVLYSKEIMENIPLARVSRFLIDVSSNGYVGDWIVISEDDVRTIEEGFSGGGSWKTTVISGITVREATVSFWAHNGDKDVILQRWSDSDLLYFTVINDRTDSFIGGQRMQATGYRIEGDRMYIYDSIGICAMMRIGGADR